MVEEYMRRMSLIHQLRLTSHLSSLDPMMSVLSANNNDFVRVRGCA
jgi:hypothetical protein